MNDKIFVNSKASFYEMIMRYMRAGILHGTRRCRFCGFEMHLGYYGYQEKNKRMRQEKPSKVNLMYWKCLYCGSMLGQSRSTLIGQENLVKFDRVLRFWVEIPAARMQEISKIISQHMDSVDSKHGFSKNSANLTVLLAVRAMAHYW